MGRIAPPFRLARSGPPASPRQGPPTALALRASWLLGHLLGSLSATRSINASLLLVPAALPQALPGYAAGRLTTATSLASATVDDTRCCRGPTAGPALLRLHSGWLRTRSTSLAGLGQARQVHADREDEEDARYQLGLTWAGRQLASRKQNCIFYNILPAGIIVVVHIGSHCLSNSSGHDGGGGRAAPKCTPQI